MLMAGILFEDIFDVKDIDPDGKKFERGDCRYIFSVLDPEWHTHSLDHVASASSGVPSLISFRLASYLSPLHLPFNLFVFSFRHSLFSVLLQIFHPLLLSALS